MEPQATNNVGEALRHELTVLMRGPGVVLDRELLAACAASAAANSLRAFRADITAFDTWCHVRAENCLPASPQLVAGFLRARAGEGAAPASLTRYRASIAKLNQLYQNGRTSSSPVPTHQPLVWTAYNASRRRRFRRATPGRPIL